MRRVLLAFTVLSTMAVALCAQVRKSDPAERIVWGNAMGECRIGCKGFPTTVPAGTPVDGIMVIENTGKDAFYLVSVVGQPSGQIQIDASLSGDRKVEGTSYSRPPESDGVVSRISRKILPSQRAEVPMRLSRLIDMTRAGEYQVKLSFRGPRTGPSTQPFDTTESKPFKILVTDQP